MVLNNIGCVHFQMGNRLAALGTFEEANDIQQLALGSSQRGDLDLLHCATILNNIGYIKLQDKNYEEARLVLEEAVLVSMLKSTICHYFLDSLLLTRSYKILFCIIGATIRPW